MWIEKDLGQKNVYKQMLGPANSKSGVIQNRTEDYLENATLTCPNLRIGINLGIPSYSVAKVHFTLKIVLYFGITFNNIGVNMNTTFFCSSSNTNVSG